MTEFLNFTYHILDKKYEQGSWVAGKMNALITINSILIGVLTLLYQNLKGPSTLTEVLVGATFLTLSSSLLCCLSGCIARRRSPTKQGYEGLLEDSLRTTAGAEDLTVVEYKRQLLQKNMGDLIELNVDLIQTLNAFITLDQRLLARGAYCTASGLLLFMCLAASLNLPLPDTVPEDQKTLDSSQTGNLPPKKAEGQVLE